MNKKEDLKKKPSPIMDIQAAVKMMGGNINIVKSVCETFVDQMPRELEQLRRSLKSRNRREVQRIAHTIKSSAKCICADPAARIALEIEMAAKEGDFFLAGELVKELLPCYDNLSLEIKKFLES